MERYAVPRLGADEKLLHTQRACLPVPGTRLSAAGVLLVLTDVRLLFAPRRLLGIPGFGESAVHRRAVALRDIGDVEPVGEGAIEVRTTSGGRVTVRILPPDGPGFVWSVRRVAPARDEAIRWIREARVRAGDVSN